MTTDPDLLAELTALRRIATALEGLDDDQQRRVLAWAADRWGGRT